MHPDDEELTTFRTRYGAYKYKVLPFGLTNGPSTFQRYINDALMGYLDDFCSAYIDDILIYSNTLGEHKSHVLKVLQRLKAAGLQADLDKCEFHVQETKFLGFIIGVNGVSVDPVKVAVVKDWKEPTTVKGVQSFLGFCNFYRKFVRKYDRVARPLTRPTKKGEAFEWSKDCRIVFDELKRRLLEAPVLAHFEYGHATRMETDASDGVLAGVLSQEHEDGWHPVAFYSETMQKAEHNYPIHNKEMLAVMRAPLCWRAELIGLQQWPFTIFTDHGALKYFSTKRLLSSRQAAWAGILSQYNFHITHRPEKENAAADALSRKAVDLKTQKDKDAQRLQPHEVMFKFPMSAFAEWKTFTPLEDLPTAERLSRQEARDAALKIQGHVEQARATIIQAQRVNSALGCRLPDPKRLGRILIAISSSILNDIDNHIDYLLFN
ncbi:unnamed protein product [Sordaria macrospora k-hell]|uniref:WGS project CABT00000000 data, contig 2.127 n=1 Tax=Sordaria macrospora (strain ATCC MYA-333 / DSM 997 / K(L3346) / K-hell) TaxID=771870 RepID=F7WCF5_SORMK|nr:uncharacterized protein SMAC_09614 [Sordaria macrospora k-hell]CCC05610.1 unnamed protein product [Sordaria macrospora k-hell]